MSNSNNQSNDFGAFLAGFVIGGLVGAAVALILAPRSGSEIRSQLMERGEEFRTRAQEYGGEYISSTRSRIQEMGGDVKERVRVVLDEGKKMANDLEERLTAANSGSDEEAADASS